MSTPNKDKPKSPLGSKVVISTSMMREQKDNIKRTPKEQEEYERFMKQQAEYRERWKHFCCLCGKEDYHHHSSRHAFSLVWMNIDARIVVSFFINTTIHQTLVLSHINV